MLHPCLHCMISINGKKTVVLLEKLCWAICISNWLPLMKPTIRLRKCGNPWEEYGGITANKTSVWRISNGPRSAYQGLPLQKESNDTGSCKGRKCANWGQKDHCSSTTCTLLLAYDKINLDPFWGRQDLQGSVSPSWTRSPKNSFKYRWPNK